MAKRKTVAERRLEEAEARNENWREFVGKLVEVKSMDDAMKLAYGPAPGQGTPGHEFYSNLAFFLGNFTVPSGSNANERAHYLKLIERLDAVGQLKAGSAESVKTAIRESLEPGR